MIYLILYPDQRPEIYDTRAAALARFAQAGEDSHLFVKVLSSKLNNEPGKDSGPTLLESASVSVR